MTNPHPHNNKIVVLISFSGEGGVERMIVNLMREFARLGHPVDLLLIKDKGEHLRDLPDNVNIIRLGTSHTWLALRPLADYLRRERPAAMLVAKHRAIIMAHLARRLAGVETRIAGRLGTNISGAMKGKHPLRERFWQAQMRFFYPRIDKIIAVSTGVADDVQQITGLDTQQLQVIRNPVITPELEQLASQAVDHPWLKPGEPPVILGAGRFTPQKDFITLIKAFAKVRQQRPCRLILLGKGGLRNDYDALIQSLNIADDVAFPGFTRNPFAYMRQASLFVLSSAWEGSPNVLTEALALGTPVVATDCPSGPREILDNGRFGPLIGIGDDDAMSQAIIQVLDHPLPPETLRAAVSEYTVENSARHYLEALVACRT